MQTNTKPRARVATAADMQVVADWSKAATRASALAAFALGASLVFLVGFAQGQTLHDAAHDTRHSNNFPCH